MSIINYKKGRISDADYLDNPHFNTNEVIGRAYDNLVDTLVGKNMSSEYRVDVDIFEDTVLDILKNIIDYNELNNRSIELGNKLSEAKEKLQDNINKLSLSSKEEISKIDSYLHNEDINRDELLSSMDSKKNIVYEIEQSRTNVKELTNSKFDIDEKIDEIKSDLIHLYSLLIVIINNLHITDVKDFDNDSIEDFMTALPYALYKEKEFFYKELEDAIFTEILFIKDIYDDIDTISFTELNNEQLDKIKNACNKYSKVKKALDIKYNALRTSYIEASNKKLDTKKNKKAYLNNVNSYKKVLNVLNSYIELADANQTDRVSQLTIDGVDQSLGSIYNSKGIDEVAKSVSELYLKDFLINSEEYRYISNSIIR